MHAILVSALNGALAFVLRTVVFKALLFSVLLVVVTQFVPALLDLLPFNPVESIRESLQGSGDAILWGFALLKLDVGLPLMLGAQVAAFAIRRLPLVG